MLACANVQEDLSNGCDDYDIHTTVLIVSILVSADSGADPGTWACPIRMVSKPARTPTSSLFRSGSGAGDVLPSAPISAMSAATSSLFSLSPTLVPPSPTPMSFSSP